jgi:hypothetical protein
MVPALLSALALLHTPTAHAQETFVWSSYGGGTPTALLSRSGTTVSGNGGGSNTTAATLGAFAVAYSPIQDKYVLLFSSRVSGGNTGSYSDCTDVFALGRAESDDGLTWTVDSSWALFPNAASGSFYHCEAVQPTLMFDEDTNVWHAWFVAKTSNTNYWDSVASPCDYTTTATGIAHATSSDGASFSVDAELAIEAPQLRANTTAACPNDVGDFGHPSVTKVGDTWYMSLYKAFQLVGLPEGSNWPSGVSQTAVLATSVDGANWGVDIEGTRALSNGANPWMNTQVRTPRLVCEDSTARGAFSLFVGGSNVATSPPPDLTVDRVTWSRDVWGLMTPWNPSPTTQLFSSTSWVTSTSAWRQWAPLRVDEDYLVYHVNSSQNALYLAYTDGLDAGPGLAANLGVITPSSNGCTRPDADSDGRLEGLDDCNDADNTVYAYTLTEAIDPDLEDCADYVEPLASPWLCGAPEYCADVDRDCSGSTEDHILPGTLPAWHADADNDGFGDLAVPYEPDTNDLLTCDVPVGFVEDDQDCDDTNDAIRPDATELCNLVDDDCDTLIDESDASDVLVWYADSDNDTFGDALTSVEACDIPDGFVVDNTDCNDALATVFPGATETCNELDDDCDTLVDEAGAVGESSWYLDFDNDGYGTAETSTVACAAPEGYTNNDEDCNDTIAAISPDGIEECNLVDDDCDGTTDESEAVGATTWYIDSDGDGYGLDATAIEACEAPSGGVAIGGDCDDSQLLINPGALEFPGNGIDEDCDGSDATSGDTDDSDVDTDDSDVDTDDSDVDTDDSDVDTDDSDVDTDDSDVDTDDSDVAANDSDDSDVDTDCANTATGGVGLAGGGGGCCARRDVDESQCAWILLPLMPLVYLRRRRTDNARRS